MLTTASVLGVLAVALGLIALAMPPSSSKNDTLSYTQFGAFSYTGRADKTSAYGPGGLSTGEPILGDSVGRVMVDFRYHLSSKAQAQLNGNLAMQAVVSLP